jgi:hypothetical protein
MTDKRLPHKNRHFARATQQPENSARHLHVTHDGKRWEAAGDAVNGVTVRSETALRNPECLETLHSAMSVLSGQRPDLPAGSGDSTLESLISGLWEDLFGFSPIGLQDDFFQLGGNSLHAARLVAKIRALTGRDLPLESFLLCAHHRAVGAIDTSWQYHLLFHPGDSPRGQTRAAVVYRS